MVGPARTTSAPIKSAVPMAMAVQTRTLWRRRSYFLAPKFCPAKVVMDTPKAPMIIQKMPSILP